MINPEIRDLISEILSEQDIVQSLLDEYDATPNWRWFRQGRILRKALSHHERSGELLDTLRGQTTEAASGE